MKIILDIPDEICEPAVLREQGRNEEEAIRQSLVALTCENCEGAKVLGKLNLPCPACHGNGWAKGKPPFPRTRRTRLKSDSPLMRGQNLVDAVRAVLDIPQPPSLPSAEPKTPESAAEAVSGDSDEESLPEKEPLTELPPDEDTPTGGLHSPEVAVSTDPFEGIPEHAAATAEPKRPRGRPRKVAALDGAHQAPVEDAPEHPLPSVYAEEGKQLRHTVNGDMITLTDVNHETERVKFETPMGYKDESSFKLLDQFYEVPDPEAVS